MALLLGKDPKITIKCLFRLCDFNQDGMFNEDEVIDVLYTFFRISLNNANNDAEDRDGCRLEQLRNNVNKAFNDKTQVSEQEFYEFCMKSEPVQELASRLGMIFMLGMMFDDSDF
ncbi:unnamed protein product [Rotaria socialis]|nr:unnamed protein product [Rotaria socialis]